MSTLLPYNLTKDNSVIPPRPIHLLSNIYCIIQTKLSDANDRFGALWQGYFSYIEDWGRGTLQSSISNWWINKITLIHYRYEAAQALPKSKHKQMLLIRDLNERDSILVSSRALDLCRRSSIKYQIALGWRWLTQMMQWTYNDKFYLHT